MRPPWPNEGLTRLPQVFAMTPPLPEARRKAAFAALVAAQQTGIAASIARETVAEVFDITAEEVLKIEREGKERQWPPLN